MRVNRVPFKIQTLINGFPAKLYNNFTFLKMVSDVWSAPTLGSVRINRDSIQGYNIEDTLYIEPSADKIDDSNRIDASWSNLLAYCYDISGWTLAGSATVNANTSDSPILRAGTSTPIGKVSELVCTASTSDGITEIATVSNATTYTLICLARKTGGAGTDFKFSCSADGGSLSAAKTATASWQIFTHAFSITTGGSITFGIYNGAASTLELEITGVALYEGDLTGWDYPPMLGGEQLRLFTSNATYEAVWTLSNLTADDDGGANGPVNDYAWRVGIPTSRLTATADNAYARSGTFNIAASDAYVTTVMLRKQSGSGDVQLTLGNGTNEVIYDIDLDAGTLAVNTETNAAEVLDADLVAQSSITALTGDWYLVVLKTFFKATTNTSYLEILLATSGDVIDIDNSNCYRLNKLNGSDNSALAEGGWSNISDEYNSVDSKLSYSGDNALDASWANEGSLGSDGDLTAFIGGMSGAEGPFASEDVAQGILGRYYYSTVNRTAAPRTDDQVWAFMFETGAGGSYCVFSDNDGSGNNVEIVTLNNTMYYRFGNSTHSFTYLLSAGWNFCIVLWDRSGNCTLYVNGVLVGTNDISGSVATDFNLDVPLFIFRRGADESIYRFGGFKLWQGAGLCGTVDDADYALGQYSALMAYDTHTPLTLAQCIASEAQPYTSDNTDVDGDLTTAAGQHWAICAVISLGHAITEIREANATVIRIQDDSDTNTSFREITLDLANDRIEAYDGTTTLYLDAANLKTALENADRLFIGYTSEARLFARLGSTDYSDTGAANAFANANIDSLSVGSKRDAGSHSLYIDGVIVAIVVAQQATAYSEADIKAVATGLLA